MNLPFSVSFEHLPENVVAAAIRALAATLAAGSISFAVATTSAGATSVTLRGSLEPDALGASATVSIAFQVHSGVSPLRSFSVSLPHEMGFAATMLGLAACPEAALLELGPTACPSESLMGSGAAEVQATFGAETIGENAHTSIFMTQPVEDHTTMLLYLEALQPVIAAVALPTEVVTSAGTSDSTLAAEIPEVAAYPGAPPISVLGVRATIGPPDLRYSRRVHGRRTSYRPAGLSVPEKCPEGGFMFVGRFRFRDGGHAIARSVVPCPRRRDRSGVEESHPA